MGRGEGPRPCGRRRLDGEVPVSAPAVSGIHDRRHGVRFQISSVSGPAVPPRRKGQGLHLVSVARRREDRDRHSRLRRDRRLQELRRPVQPGRAHGPRPRVGGRAVGDRVDGRRRRRDRRAGLSARSNSAGAGRPPCRAQSTADAFGRRDPSWAFGAPRRGELAGRGDRKAGTQDDRAASGAGARSSIAASPVVRSDERPDPQERLRGGALGG